MISKLQILSQEYLRLDIDHSKITASNWQSLARLEISPNPPARQAHWDIIGFFTFGKNVRKKTKKMTA